MVSKSLVSVLKSLPRRLSRPLRIRIYVSFFLAAVVSVTQLSVVVGVSLLGATLSSPTSITESKYFNYVEFLMPQGYWSDPKIILLVVVGVCVGAVTVNNCAKLCNDYWVVTVAREVERSFGIQLLSGFLALPYEWHLSKNSSDLTMSVHWATHYGVFIRSATVIGGDILSVAIVLAGVLFLDPWIALCVVGVLGVIAVLLFSLMKSRVDYYSNEYREATLKNLRVVNLALQGIKDVKLFGREARLQTASDSKLERCVRMAAKQELFRISPMYILEVVGFLMIFALVFWMLFKGGEFSHIAGTVALLAAAGWKLLPSVNKILGAVTGLRVSWPFVQKAEAYFGDIQVAHRSSPCEQSFPLAEGVEKRIELQGINFSYQGGGAGLYDVDMAIEKGQAIGIVGPSGSGKSTLVNILSGLLCPQAGEILVDGKSLSSEAIKVWQVASVGYVPQSPYICDATLAENVAFGLWGDDIDQNMVRRCCEMAAMDFIDGLPQGINTPIGERGVRLSGGQQQRVAIARALYKKAEIIIFDEATSSLDTKSEKSIQETIYSLKGQVTLIIVAHRLSTIEECDQVYWIDAGRLHMAGSARAVLDSYRAMGEV